MSCLQKFRQTQISAPGGQISQKFGTLVIWARCYRICDINSPGGEILCSHRNFWRHITSTIILKPFFEHHCKDWDSNHPAHNIELLPRPSPPMPTWRCDDDASLLEVEAVEEGKKNLRRGRRLCVACLLSCSTGSSSSSAATDEAAAAAAFLASRRSRRSLSFCKQKVIDYCTQWLKFNFWPNIRNVSSLVKTIKWKAEDLSFYHAGKRRDGVSPMND